MGVGAGTRSEHRPARMVDEFDRVREESKCDVAAGSGSQYSNCQHSDGRAMMLVIMLIQVVQ
jgi:hypothetical protein